MLTLIFPSCQSFVAIQVQLALERDIFALVEAVATKKLVDQSMWAENEESSPVRQPVNNVVLVFFLCIFEKSIKL